MRARVLIAEDDEKQAELVRRYLERDGHHALVVRDGQAALDEVRRRRPDLLVLDVMLPGVGGLEVCRVLRRESGLPVLMLTARSAESDLLLGLDVGADDYMTKPYSPRELMARIRALLRRAAVPAAAANRVLRVGALTVDPVRHEVAVAGTPVGCTPAEFEILAALAGEPGRVFTRAQLLERASGFESQSTERAIDMHVMNLRRKIEPDPRRPAQLVTVFGIGYKFADGAGEAPAGDEREP
jgi:DNA-binding response OmpR family regulator